VLPHELLHPDEVDGESRGWIDGTLDEDDELVIVAVGVETRPLVEGKAMGSVELKLDP
jgi:hypothetical protein